MPPGRELLLGSVLSAIAVTVFGFVAFSWTQGDAPDRPLLRMALPWSVPGIVSAAIAAVVVRNSHAYALRRGQHWSAIGMALRVLLLAFVAFPPAAALWFVLSVVAGSGLATQPKLLREAIAMAPLVVLYATVLAVVFGALPALLLEFFLCRRFLRRVPAVTSGQP